VRVLVSDASVLIELSKWSLLEAIFALPCEFAVPDILYEDELLDLHGLTREDLVDLGLRVEHLDSDGVSRAIGYQARRPQLSLPDCFAIALSALNEWPLLSSDKRMRQTAEEETIEVLGVFWVIDQLEAEGIVSTETLAEALAGMLKDPRTYLPAAEIRRRLKRMRGNN
jgi:predicted nucleic acid-binding protein